MNTGALIFIIALLWILPTIVAYVRNHHDTTAINVLIFGGGVVAMIDVYPGMSGVIFPANILSWLQLVWAIAMVWSFTWVRTQASSTPKPSEQELLAMGYHKL
jgi:uncharacterized membrane protein YhaH (DUF805 family)